MPTPEAVPVEVTPSPEVQYTPQDPLTAYSDYEYDKKNQTKAVDYYVNLGNFADLSKKKSYTGLADSPDGWKDLIENGGMSDDQLNEFYHDAYEAYRGRSGADADADAAILSDDPDLAVIRMMHDSQSTDRPVSDEEVLGYLGGYSGYAKLRLEGADGSEFIKYLREQEYAVGPDGVVTTGDRAANLWTKKLNDECAHYRGEHGQPSDQYYITPRNPMELIDRRLKNGENRAKLRELKSELNDMKVRFKNGGKLYDHYKRIMKDLKRISLRDTADLNVAGIKKVVKDLRELQGLLSTDSIQLNAVLALSTGIPDSSLDIFKDNVITAYTNLQGLNERYNLAATDAEKAAVKAETFDALRKLKAMDPTGVVMNDLRSTVITILGVDQDFDESSRDTDPMREMEDQIKIQEDKYKKWGEALDNSEEQLDEESEYYRQYVDGMEKRRYRSETAIMTAHRSVRQAANRQEMGRIGEQMHDYMMSHSEVMKTFAEVLGGAFTIAFEVFKNPLAVPQKMATLFTRTMSHMLSDFVELDDKFGISRKNTPETMQDISGAIAGMQSSDSGWDRFKGTLLGKMFNVAALDIVDGYCSFVAQSGLASKDVTASKDMYEMGAALDRMRDLNKEGVVLHNERGEEVRIFGFKDGSTEEGTHLGLKDLEDLLSGRSEYTSLNTRADKTGDVVNIGDYKKRIQIYSREFHRTSAELIRYMEDNKKDLRDDWELSKREDMERREKEDEHWRKMYDPNAGIGVTYGQRFAMTLGLFNKDGSLNGVAFTSTGSAELRRRANSQLQNTELAFKDLSMKAHELQVKEESGTLTEEEENDLRAYNEALEVKEEYERSLMFMCSYLQLAATVSSAAGQTRRYRTGTNQLELLVAEMLRDGDIIGALCGKMVNIDTGEIKDIPRGTGKEPELVLRDYSARFDELIRSPTPDKDAVRVFTNGSDGAFLTANVSVSMEALGVGTELDRMVKKTAQGIYVPDMDARLSHWGEIKSACNKVVMYIAGSPEEFTREIYSQVSSTYSKCLQVANNSKVKLTEDIKTTFRECHALLRASSADAELLQIIQHIANGETGGGDYMGLLSPEYREAGVVEMMRDLRSDSIEFGVIPRMMYAYGVFLNQEDKSADKLLYLFRESVNNGEDIRDMIKTSSGWNDENDALIQLESERTSFVSVMAAARLNGLTALAAYIPMLKGDIVKDADWIALEMEAIDYITSFRLSPGCNITDDMRGRINVESDAYGREFVSVPIPSRDREHPMKVYCEESMGDDEAFEALLKHYEDFLDKHKIPLKRENGRTTTDPRSMLGQLRFIGQSVECADYILNPTLNPILSCSGGLPPVLYSMDRLMGVTSESGLVNDRIEKNRFKGIKNGVVDLSNKMADLCGDEGSMSMLFTAKPLGIWVHDMIDQDAEFKNDYKIILKSLDTGRRGGSVARRYTGAVLDRMTSIMRPVIWQMAACQQQAINEDDLARFKEARYGQLYAELRRRRGLGDADLDGLSDEALENMANEQLEAEIEDWITRTEAANKSKVERLTEERLEAARTEIRRTLFEVVRGTGSDDEDERALVDSTEELMTRSTVVYAGRSFDGIDGALNIALNRAEVYSLFTRAADELRHELEEGTIPITIRRGESEERFNADLKRVADNMCRWSLSNGNGVTFGTDKGDVERIEAKKPEADKNVKRLVDNLNEYIIAELCVEDPTDSKVQRSRSAKQRVSDIICGVGGVVNPWDGLGDKIGSIAESDYCESEEGAYLRETLEDLTDALGALTSVETMIRGTYLESGELSGISDDERRVVKFPVLGPDDDRYMGSWCPSDLCPRRCDITVKPSFNLSATMVMPRVIELSHELYRSIFEDDYFKKMRILSGTEFTGEYESEDDDRFGLSAFGVLTSVCTYGSADSDIKKNVPMVDLVMKNIGTHLKSHPEDVDVVYAWLSLFVEEATEQLWMIDSRYARLKNIRDSISNDALKGQLDVVLKANPMDNKDMQMMVQDRLERMRGFLNVMNNEMNLTLTRISNLNALYPR